MAKKVKTICEEKISPIIEEMGYEVIDIEYAKKSDGMNLTFYIDKENGIQIQDCEAVSRAIDPILEELNPTDDVSYILSVSSPGLDRPLTKERDFQKNLNNEVCATLFAKINGKKKFEGTLVAYDDKFITLNVNEEKVVLSREQVAHIVPIIKF